MANNHPIHLIKQRTFILYFLSFLLSIVFSVIILGIVSYQLTVGSLEHEIIKSSSNALQQTNATLVSTLNEINDVTFQIGLNGSVSNYLYNTDNRFLLNAIHDTIKNYKQSHDYIESIELYAKPNKHIISSMGATQLFNNQISYQWIGKMENSKAQTKWLLSGQHINSEYKKINIISFIRKLPIGYNLRLGYIALHIDEQSISSIINTFNIHEDARTYMIDSTKSIISSLDKSLINQANDQVFIERIVNNTKMEGQLTTPNGESLVFYIKNNVNDWIIISEVPYTYITYKTNKILFTTLTLCLGIIILGIIAAYYLSIRLYKPIIKLMAKAHVVDAEPQENSRNEFSYLSGVFDHITIHNKNLKKDIFLSAPALKEKFAYDLIHHKYTSLADVKEQITFLKLQLSVHDYVVLLIEIDNFDAIFEHNNIEDINLHKFAMDNIIHEIFIKNYTILTVDVDMKRLCLIVNVNTNEHLLHCENLYSLSKELIQVILSILKIEVTVSIGNIYDSILQLDMSYREAHDIMNYKIVLSKNIMFYEHYNNDVRMNYHYPIHTISHIINNLKTGDANKIARYLDKITDDIKKNYNLTYENIYRIFNQVIDSLILTLQELQIPLDKVLGKNYFIYKELSNQKSIDSINDWLKEIFSKCCQFIHANNPDSNHYVEKIRSYINNNYKKDIFIDIIADYVNLNATYMCRIFKQETGKTVLEYITEKRMEEGKTLLINTDLTIGDIAGKLGYNNVHSFMRHFKSAEGITPGNYRKMAR